ncbi:large conductance mechanosensitive channel protein MscL [Gorillibacterium timonense]|uniref:large conductance mechanosensitive channel protein MscL n=1 Tax=Gorillibacterium timonense TaxID=1689269 RepID=UPI00071DB595|nr:large conductance mechanosensitive channel protein MscL [Gorillibacterium timonense]
MWKEFKAFALKGNVLDLAVGVIIGGAFGSIVSSLVKDIIMPLVGILIGGYDFKSLAITVGDAKITYGEFLQTTLNFFIIAFSIFLFIKLLGKLTRKKEEAPKPAEPPVPSKEEVLLTEIRDLLKQQKQTGRSAE